MALDTVATKTFAPGARVEIRDEEWIVRSVHQATLGGTAVKVTGTSELVRGKEAIFLTELDEVTELRPEETKLVPDDSPHYRRSRLYLESLLRRTPPTDAALYVGHRGAIDRADYQMQPAQKALRQPRPRILMADGVGLGKTIEVGILLSELIRRGRADRILVVALKSILAQFQEELWARFAIPLVRLDSVGLQRVQTRIPSNMNPFYHFDRAIISIDTLKRDAKYRRYLEKCHWDVVVVDECQNVAVRSRGGYSSKSQRARLADLLASTCDALILTSATPHDGQAKSFASLMNLLEPTAVADEDNYTRDEVEHLFLRRFKKDIAHEVADAFQERLMPPLGKVDASPEENAVFETFSEITFRTIDRNRKNKGILFRTLLLKGFLSSPIACLTTIENRLAHKDLEDTADPAVIHDCEQLGALKTQLQAIGPGQFTKYQKLLTLLREAKIGAKDSDERVVIFSERIPTLNFLEERLKRDLKLGKNAIEIFHGTLDDQDQKHLVKEFGTRSTPVRILLASDAASEGINLHYFCHRMIHFDLPWSLITLNQRNGRIDRYGQKHRPEIRYLLTIPADPELKGDLRVLERLIEKEDTANKNLGDVAWLMGLHESESEEDHIASGIESGEAPEAIIPEEPDHTDFMDLLLSGEGQDEPPPTVHDPLTLYANDLAYARDAFDETLSEPENYLEWYDHLDGFALRAPADLLRRCDYLPAELRNKHWEFKLTTDRPLVMKALEESREKEDTWPEWQLFWELHPVAGWLNDRVLGCFERHEAPVLRLTQGLDPEERVVMFQAVLSNRRSQPMLVDWFGIGFRGQTFDSIHPMEDLIARTGLGEGLPNQGGVLTPSLKEDLVALLPPAVEQARTHMTQRRVERTEDLAAPLRDGLGRLSTWKDQKIRDIDRRKQALFEKGKLGPASRRQLNDERARAERLYEERAQWIDDGMRTDPKPYLRVAAVLIHQEAGGGA